MHVCLCLWCPSSMGTIGWLRVFPRWNHCRENPLVIATATLLSLLQLWPKPKTHYWIVTKISISSSYPRAEGKFYWFCNYVGNTALATPWGKLIAMHILLQSFCLVVCYEAGTRVAFWTNVTFACRDSAATILAVFNFQSAWSFLHMDSLSK